MWLRSWKAKPTILPPSINFKPGWHLPLCRGIGSSFSSNKRGYSDSVPANEPSAVAVALSPLVKELGSSDMTVVRYLRREGFQGAQDRDPFTACGGGRTARYSWPEWSPTCWCRHRRWWRYL